MRQRLFEQKVVSARYEICEGSAPSWRMVIVAPIQSPCEVGLGRPVIRESDMRFPSGESVLGTAHFLADLGLVCQKHCPGGDLGLIPTSVGVILPRT